VLATPDLGPVIVGGVGGSGTRVVVELLEAMGFYFGRDRNISRDNMGIARSFPTMRRIVLGDDPGPLLRFASRISGRGNPTGGMPEVERILFNYAERIRREALVTRPVPSGFGWKNPQSFHLLDALARIHPTLCFVLVLRNGLDMAFSSNQNQTREWGPRFGIEATARPNPRESLRYWVQATKYALDHGRAVLGKRFFVLRFDDLCGDPASMIARLADFVEVTRADTAAMSRRVRPPRSIGRHGHHDLTQFDPADVAFVRDLRFEVITAQSRA